MHTHTPANCGGGIKATKHNFFFEILPFKIQLIIELILAKGPQILRSPLPGSIQGLAEMLFKLLGYEIK